MRYFLYFLKVAITVSPVEAKTEPMFRPSRTAGGRKAFLATECWASQGPSRVFMARKKFHWFRTKLKQQVFRDGVLKFQL